VLSTPPASEKASTREVPTEREPDGESVGAVPADSSGATVRGRVLDEKGDVLEGAGVSALVIDDRITASVATQADGTFELRGLEPERVILFVGAKEMREASVDLGAMKPGEIRDGVEIRLEPRSPITGHVQWPDGNPAAGSVVVYSPEQDSDMGFSDETVTCDDLGEFRIVAPIDDKPMSLTAFWPTDLEVPVTSSEPVFSWVSHRDDVAQGSSGLILTLAPSSSLRVSVQNEKGVDLGNICRVYAVPYCREHAFPIHGFRANGVLDGASHESVLDGLHEGRWLLVVEATDHVRVESLLQIPRDAGRTSILLPRTVTLSGVVFDPRGLPSPHAALFSFLSSEDKQPDDDHERALLVGSADEEGRFELRGVPPGRLILETYSENRDLRARTELTVESERPPPELKVFLRTKAETPEMDRPRGRSLRR
jgi:hypothetical protein